MIVFLFYYSTPYFCSAIQRNQCAGLSELHKFNFNNTKVMNTLEVLGTNPNISITINGGELRKAFATLIDSAIDKYKREVEAQPDDILYSIKQVSEILSVDKSTLWRWQQSGYLVPTKVGDLPRYRKSQIDELLGAKRGGAK